MWYDWLFSNSYYTVILWAVAGAVLGIVVRQHYEIRSVEEQARYWEEQANYWHLQYITRKGAKNDKTNES